MHTRVIHRDSLLALLTSLSLTLACGSSHKAGTADPGALVTVGMSSQVGVLLDELPASMRDRVAKVLLVKPDSFWIARAQRQLTLATYRLNFRQSFYDEADDKQQPPLPPEELLKITIATKNGAKARRARVEGHDYVLVDYVLASTLLTDAASPKTSEPALAELGGSWDEPFVFPVDPELLVQRTGYACMDEAEFPPNSVDSEDVEFFYDQECEVEAKLTKDGCHFTKLATQSCLAALTSHVGKVATALHFERVAWNETQAKAVRIGKVSNPTGADLEVLGAELLTNRLTYRYVASDSCALVEKCVGGQGWRRLLQFNASEKDTGITAVNIGDVDYFLDDPKHPTPNANHHLYEYSPCHHHYHFSHYATFTYGGDKDLGSKRAFCLESVARYANNEHSPLWSPYNDCAFQGISEGWGDQYNAGIECQWVDVTTIDTSAGAVTKPLGLRSNPDGFMCEGTPVVDAKGDLVWEATKFKNSKGQTVDRPKCNFMKDWDANNYAQTDVRLPPAGEGMVTSPCTRGQLGLHRNCGLNYAGKPSSCTAGKTVELRCSVPEKSMQHVIRVCEASAVLAAGVACTDADALATAEVGDATVAVSFKCPAARDAHEPGGSYALYTGPSFPEDPAATVTCSLK